MAEGPSGTTSGQRAGLQGQEAAARAARTEAAGAVKSYPFAYFVHRAFSEYISSNALFTGTLQAVCAPQPEGRRLVTPQHFEPLS